MKEDYLWDKTGTDPEIEKLETALQAFRYRETAPPRLPSKVLPFKISKKEPARKFFQIGLACAAGVAFVLILLGLWFQVSSSSKLPIASGSANSEPPQLDAQPGENTFVREPDVLPISRPPAVPQQLVRRNLTKARQSAPAIHRQNKTIARNFKIKNRTVKLTEEEKYAYGQLMLALSITGSKLKLVTDKIAGIEEPTKVFKTQK